MDQPRAEAVIAAEAVTEAPDVATAPKQVMLPAETAVMFIMDQPLASDKKPKVSGQPKPPKGQRRLTNAGDTFTMSVKDDVVEDGVVVIPAGSVGHGEVLLLLAMEGFASGKIEIKMNYVQVDDQQIPLSGTYLQKGKGRGGAAVAGTIVAGVIAGVFIKGAEADIPYGAEIMFRTMDAVTFTGPAPVETAPPVITAKTATTTVGAAAELEDVVNSEVEDLGSSN